MVYTIKNYYMNDFGFVSKFVFILCSAFVSKFVFILFSTFVLLLSLVIVCVCGRKECVCACASSILLAFMPVYLFEREKWGREKHPIGLYLSLSFFTLPQLYINIWLKSHKLICLSFHCIKTLYYYRCTIIFNISQLNISYKYLLLLSLVIVFSQT